MYKQVAKGRLKGDDGKGVPAVFENERAVVEEILGRIAWNREFKREILDDPTRALEGIGISVDELPKPLNCEITCRRSCKKSCQVTES